MCQHTTRLLVALLTFTVGTAAGLFWDALGPAQLPDEAVPAPAVRAAVVDVPAKPPAPRPSRLAAGAVLNSRAVILPAPEYSSIARSAHAQGPVVVQVVVDEKGDVVMASAVSGHPLLQHASVAAARQAKFAPTMLDGRPISVAGVVRYNFVLQ